MGKQARIARGAFAGGTGWHAAGAETGVALGADCAFIDPTVAIIVGAITCLGKGWTAEATGIEHIFIPTPITVVVKAVANFIHGFNDIFTGPKETIAFACFRVHYAGHWVTSATSWAALAHQA